MALKTLVHEYLFGLYSQPEVKYLPGDLFFIRESVSECGAGSLHIKGIMGVPAEPPILVITCYYGELEGSHAEGTLHVTARDRNCRIDNFALKLVGFDHIPMLHERIISAFEQWLSTEVEEFLGEEEEEDE